MGDFVYDPFAGTGSIITACAYFQGFCFGSDLDIRVLKGYGVGRATKCTGIKGMDEIKRFDIYTNFYHYKLPLPEVFSMDCATMNFHKLPLFDAIVCDPPYGVRARS